MATDPPPVITLDGRSLTPAAVVAIARGRAEARMASAARERNAAAERLVRSLLERGELLYGVTTGVGSLRSSPSADEGEGDHQWRLLRSHAGGGGAPLTVEVVRAAMAVRANQLGAGGAGVGERLLDALLGALHAGVTPFARELGSLGTGDLTVLAEIGTALGGEGECWVGDEVVPAAEALAAHGLEPVRYTHYNRDPERARFFATNNLAVPRDAFLELGGFDVATFPFASEDRDLCDRWRASGRGLRSAPDAVVRHAHDLDLRGFVRQHVAYGRGAARYHRARALRGTGRLLDETSFHLDRSLWLRTARLRPARRAAGMVPLLALWQAANATGYLLERAGDRSFGGSPHPAATR